MIRCGFLGVLVCAAVLTGCGGKSGEKAAGSVLHVNAGTEVQDLDPHLTTGVPEHRVLSALFEGLTDLDMATLDPVPGVAESWTLSDDKTVYSFKLRENATWSNGDPVTAEDFVYSWRRMLTPAFGAEYAEFLYLLKNGRAYNTGEISDFSQVGVKALDPQTLEVTLEHPTPYFLTVHQHQAWYPVHQATIEKFGKIDQRGSEWTRAGNLVSNGPFVLAEWHPNEVIKVRKRPTYWDAEHVRLDEIDFYPISDTQTEERAFRSGELDWTEELPLQSVATYQKEHPELLHIHPYLGVYYYRLNVTRKPLHDSRVRQALSLALNREELTQNVLKAGEQPAYQFVPQEIENYKSTTKVDYNPEKARQLLAEAGFPGGKDFPALEILYNTKESHKMIAEVVQRMWKQELNINVQLLNQDWKVYLENLDSLNYDISRSAWIADYEDPISFLDTMTSENGNNRTGWKSAPFDQMIQQAEAATDDQARTQFLQQAEQVLMQDMPLIPMYFYVRKFLIDPKVKGYVDNPLGYIRWNDIYFEAAAK